MSWPKLVNPALFLVLIVLVTLVRTGENQGDPQANWVLSLTLTLLAVALIANVALSLARVFARRPVLSCAVWSLVFLMMASFVWMGNLIEAEAPIDENEWVFEGVPEGAERERAVALLYAAARGQEEVLEQMLPQLTLGNEPTRAAAVVAIEFNRRACLELLLDRGLPAISQWQGQSLVSTAIIEKRPELLRLVLERGGDANAMDAEGYTPLMQAAHGNDERAVNILRDFGAKPHFVNPQGYRAVDFASESRVVEALERP